MKARDAIHEHIGYECAGLVGDDTVTSERTKRRGMKADLAAATAVLAIVCAGFLAGGSDATAEVPLQVAAADELQAAEERGEQRARAELLATVAAARNQGRRDALNELRMNPTMCKATKGGR